MRERGSERRRAIEKGRERARMRESVWVRECERDSGRARYTAREEERVYM